MSSTNSANASGESFAGSKTDLVSFAVTDLVSFADRLCFFLIMPTRTRGVASLSIGSRDCGSTALLPPAVEPIPSTVVNVTNARPLRVFRLRSERKPSVCNEIRRHPALGPDRQSISWHNEWIDFELRARGMSDDDDR